MRFWDTSAVVPLLVQEARSSAALEAIAFDRDICVWWGAPVECLSAIARVEREGRLAASDVADAVAALGLLRSGWIELDGTARLRDIAERIVRTHPLRAADAFRLAAAISAAEGQPPTLPFVTLDDRLAGAAAREGFPVIRFDA